MSERGESERVRVREERVREITWQQFVEKFVYSCRIE